MALGLFGLGGFGFGFVVLLSFLEKNFQMFGGLGPNVKKEL